ncbi:MAG TPA: 50S ribosomal protein L25/general stress protein Ctc [Bacillota bacterium]|jgi:large subunit ribosomal protein L25|nr:50S ribosomal protein L25/general stress protein Ctc [Bacillota bacterium]
MNTLVAQKRTDFRKSVLNKLRNSGKIPAVVYGKNIDTESISIGNTDLMKVMRTVGRNGIFTLDLDGEKKDVFLKEYQVHPISGKLLHVGLLQVDKETEIDAKVAVVLKGTSKGEKDGGIVQQILHELDITAKASDIPNEIEIDIADLEIGDTMKVADIKGNYHNLTFHHEDDEAIVTIDFVKMEEDIEEETAEEAEPSGV